MKSKERDKSILEYGEYEERDTILEYEERDIEKECVCREKERKRAHVKRWRVCGVCREIENERDCVCREIEKERDCVCREIEKVRDCMCREKER